MKLYTILRCKNGYLILTGDDPVVHGHTTKWVLARGAKELGKSIETLEIERMARGE